MSLSKAVIAIKGNQLGELSEITAILNYLEDESLLAEFAKTAQYANGWTTLDDPEMVFVTEDDLLADLAEALETEVFAFAIQSTSTTYSFSDFNNGENRIFAAQDGEIIENSGAALAVEAQLNINEHIAAADILEIAKRLGIIVAV